MKNADVKRSFERPIEDKINELREKIMSLKSDDCKLSKNTKSTQLFQRNRELKVLRLIKALLNDDATGKDTDTLVSLTMLTGERGMISIDFMKGDMLIDILQKYQNVKNIGSKIEKVCKKKGLKIDYSQDGLIVEA